MNKEELAAKLMGVQIDYFMYEHQEEAEENGLIVIFAQSDDLTVFIGAIEAEAGCYNSKTVHIDAEGVLEDFEEFNNNSISEAGMRRYLKRKDASKALKIVKTLDDQFTYAMNIPYANFNMYDGSDLYCIGIVISVEDLKE